MHPSVEHENTLMKLKAPDLDKQDLQNAGCCGEFNLLLWRNFVSVWRDPMQSTAKVV